MIANRRHNGKALAIDARSLILREAATPLPEDPSERELEGARRLEAASLDLAASHRRTLKCAPGTVLGTAVEIVQAIYTLLKAIGQIAETGKAT